MGAPGIVIGGTAPEAGNVIAFNGGLGVYVRAGTGNAILGNSIFANGDLGIDLGVTANNANDGVTPNDPGDADAGPNDRLNFPVLTSARLAGPDLVLEGFARPGSAIELFVADPDPTGFGEGRTYLVTRVEGSADDLDPSTGSYGPGRDRAGRRRFAPHGA